MKSFLKTSLFLGSAVPTALARINRNPYRVALEAEHVHPIKGEGNNGMLGDEYIHQLEQEAKHSRFLDLMSMPLTCDSTYSCPDSCDCGGNVQDGGDVCGCYSITSVQPPFDSAAVPPSGTWYCYQVDLDKSVDGCSGAKAVSHSVLATGFSESCLFHPSGLDVGGSDDWSDHTCDNTAATGLKYDFGHSGSGNQLSVTYCFDVSCEAAPAGEGSINWVLKAGNDRCEIEVIL